MVFFLVVVLVFMFFLILFSFFVISSRNPIHSVLSLISVFLLSAILLLCLEVEFIALSFIIVYVGAIAILFLFVVMMLDIKISDDSFSFLKYGSPSYFVSFVVLFEATKPLNDLTFFSSSAFLTDYTWVNWFAEVESISNVQILGQLLYTYYFVFFLIAGFILFVAVLGALMLTLTLNKTIKV
jgi:NADH-quinone oxidoreductase subunit J